jgi:hypothetical protein
VLKRFTGKGELLCQYLYICTGKASKLSTSQGRGALNSFSGARVGDCGPACVGREASWESGGCVGVWNWPEKHVRKQYLYAPSAPSHCPAPICRKK